VPGTDSRRGGVVRTLRLLGVGWAMHLKMMSQSAFDGLLGVLWPLFFATVAFFMFQAGAGGETLVYASFGAAVMGIWSATSTSAARRCSGSAGTGRWSSSSRRRRTSRSCSCR
jgi:hypothetical protein